MDSSYFIIIIHVTSRCYSSWYHGAISRHTSFERLQQMGEPGAYLVRDSTNHIGDYAIAYLSRMKQIHHFKINSVCGDYYIGGRQFSSLVELIGYYTNCSCILENEKLEVPVMPPSVSFPHVCFFLAICLQSHEIVFDNYSLSNSCVYFVSRRVSNYIR